MTGRLGAGRLLTSGDLARYGIGPATVARWVRDKGLTVISTLGGHSRYREAEVLALLAGEKPAA